MPESFFEVKYLHDRGECVQRIDRSTLEVLMKYRPVIEIDGRTYDIERVNYEPETDTFYIHLLDC